MRQQEINKEQPRSRALIMRCSFFLSFFGGGGASKCKRPPLLMPVLTVAFRFIRAVYLCAAETLSVKRNCNLEVPKRAEGALKLWRVTGEKVLCEALLHTFLLTS